jgi:hypothetical protein
MTDFPQIEAIRDQFQTRRSNRSRRMRAMPPVRPMETLVLRRASDSRPPAVGPDDYHVVGRDGETIGRVLRARVAPADTPWMWSLMDAEQTVATGYSDSRDAATQALAEALVMTDCLPGLMLKRTDRRDEECYDVMSNGEVVGHLRLSDVAPAAAPWVWAIAFDHRDGRKSNRGYAPTREAAMQAFAKVWHRE